MATPKEIAGAPQQEPGETYKPPPASACNEASYFMPLSQEDRLACHQRHYKKRIVHFSIEHQHLWDGDWKKVARIDTKNTIHLHLWDRYDNILIDHRLMAEIPPSPEGQQVVHNGWERAFNYLDDHWREHLRRWSE